MGAQEVVYVSTPNLNLNDLLNLVAERVANSVAVRLGTPEPVSPWLTVPEAAEYCKLTDDAIRGAEKRGQLRAHRSGTGRVRFLQADLDGFLRGDV